MVETADVKICSSPSRLWQLLLISIMFIAAFGIRLYGIASPPLNFHPIRQYHSFIVARGYYFEHIQSLPDWRRQIAAINAQSAPTAEPRIMEHLAYWGYRIIGGEHFWIPRLFSCVFWLIGGGFLHLLARKLIPPDGAWFAAAFYLFVPYGIFASQSFQPDPMMVMMMLIGIYAIWQYFDRPSILRLIIAAVACACAVFIKPVCVFIIFAGFISLAYCEKQTRKPLARPDFWLFATITLIPTVIYCLWGLFISDFLAGQPKLQFRPYLILSLPYWLGWLKQIGLTVGVPAFIAAALAILLFSRGRPRALLIGLWLGYLVYGLVFSYAIHTHNYYQMPFIPVVALGLAAICSYAVKRLRRMSTVSHLVMMSIGLLLVILLFMMYNIINGKYERIKFSPNTIRKAESFCRLVGIDNNFLERLRKDYTSQVKIAEQIGQTVNHSINTISLEYHNGRFLNYHGQISGRYWPTLADIHHYRTAPGGKITTEKRFNLWLSKCPFEYFIVTNFQEFDRQPDLKKLLNQKYPILVQNDNYLIFDLR